MLRVSFQVFGIIAFAFILFVGWDFGQRVILTLRLKQAEQSYDQQIARAEATHTALLEQKKLVQTDAFIEELVRRERHYVRDGETLVIPQKTPAAAPIALIVPSPTASTPGANWWQDLLQFLFGP